jgi:hypothetical protein
MDKRIQVLAAMAAVLLTFPMEVQAADAPVPYISGGTGADAREALLAREKEFNLKIVVADKSGDYLAGVKVVIESAQKAQVLDTTMEGPILLAKLPPGTYTIRATSSDQKLTRIVTIAAQGLQHVDLRWDVSK